MDETILPPSPNWFLPKVISCRDYDSIAYSSKNSIVVLKILSNNKFHITLIRNGHTRRVTAVALSPSNCSKSIQNTVVSCSEDGLLKLWKVDLESPFLGHNSHWEQNEYVGKVICLDWSLANPHHIISVADNNSVVLWDVLCNTTIRFSFQKLNATDLAACPYNEKIVAVGTKSGLIQILSLTKNGETLFKLRGHDNEIQSLSWCPMPYNVFRTKEICEEFLLASACLDKEIFIWRVGSDGKCETKIHMPTSSISKKGREQCHVKMGNNSFTTLFWSDPYKIYITSNFGELIYFDINLYILNKSGDVHSGKKEQKQLNFFKLGHCFHSRGLFTVAGWPVQGEVVLYENISVKSDLKYKIEANKVNITEKLSNGDSSEKKKEKSWEICLQNELSVLWTAGLDKKLIGCRSHSTGLEKFFNFHTILGFVYCAVVSPHDPNIIAIGAGDGVVRLWNLTEQSGEIKLLWQKIKGGVITLAWHPSKDGILAYGTTEGRVGLIDTNSTKPPNVFKPSHTESIYSLSWGPQFVEEQSGDIKSESEFCLYCVGNNILSMYKPSNIGMDALDLSKIIPFPCKKQTDVSWNPDYSLMAVGSEDGTVCLVDATTFKIVHTVQMYKKLIQSLVWHPTSTSVDTGLSPYHGYFTSGSTDKNNEIRIFNCIREDNKITVEQVGVLKGHYGYIQSVSWCPHIGGRLASTSTDYSVQIWDVNTQSPLVNYVPYVKTFALFSIWSPIDPDLIISGFWNCTLQVWRISLQTKTSPQPLITTKKPKVSLDGLVNKVVQETVETDKKKKTDCLNIGMAEGKEVNKSSESKMFSKAWKGDVNEQLNVCYSLLKNEKSERNGSDYSLQFLCHEESYKDIVKSEEELFKKNNNWTEVYELSLWNGTLKEKLEEKIKTGQLNDFLVSLAPTVSPRLWQEACLSYSKTLAERKMFKKAACYLIICHKIYEAIQLLMNANLYLEAFCIAKNRLPKSDPLLTEIIRDYAQWLFKNGSFLKACECYIYLEEYSEVAKICGKKNKPEYLRLAALASRKCGLEDLEATEATNALLKCFEVNNFELAESICNDHSNLKHLHLMYLMYLTLHQLDEGDLVIEDDILTHMQGLKAGVVFPSSSFSVYNKYTYYKDKQKMMITLAQELSFASCAKDLETTLTHIIKALSTCYRFIHNSENEIHIMYKLCKWLSPKKFLSENSWFQARDNEMLPKSKSMRAFLCASLVRYLCDNPGHHDISENFCILIKELINDLLDKDSYMYYKNLIEVEICEKRLIKSRTKLGRNQLSNDICDNSKNNNDLDPSKNSIVQSDVNTIERNSKRALSASPDRGNLEKVSEEVIDVGGDASEQIDINSDNQFPEKHNDEDITEKISNDMLLLSKLKGEIENFEKIRISSPNPIPVYFMLKRLCENEWKFETARTLLQELEAKWKSIN